ncbi:MAG TPA: pimeloyl-ACP methyl ester esterase BioH [Methylophilaceae bacterium]|nr:pimeloyl-ACP methyl ester esterase BioH [Methylophilaceae bacterium]
MSSLFVENQAHSKPAHQEAVPNLVLVHGWGMHGGVWQPVAKKLSGYFNLHIVDLPGMGFSKPVEPSDLDTIADKVLEVLPPNADVCGWSFGSHVVMRAALKQPDSIRRVVLVAGTPKFVNSEALEPWHIGIEAEVYQRFATSVSQDYQETLIRFFSLQCMGADGARNTIKQLRKSFSERPVPTMGSLQKALRILLENDMRTAVTNIKKPVLLIHGDRDRLVPVQAGHWMAQHMPFARLRVIAGAGHAPFLSHQDQFVEALVQYLEPPVFPQ